MDSASDDGQPRPHPVEPAPAELQAPARALSEAAKRALAEAQERRAELDRRAAELARVRERDGRDGPEPVRYGDWEVKGLASDF